ncbi:MAG: hypothetical protein IPO30_00945 [Hyphomonadaceae bacterium]|nr:hypothetical protein [Hyphomonadaceae bacterium]
MASSTNIFDSIQYDNRTIGLRRADATAAFQYDVNANLVGDTPARFIPHELQVWRQHGRDEDPVGRRQIAGGIPLTTQEAYRIRVWGGVEFQIHFWTSYAAP